MKPKEYTKYYNGIKIWGNKEEVNQCIENLKQKKLWENMKCRICGLEEDKCPMMTGEMSMYMTPKEIRGIPNRKNSEQQSL
jgi:hypothetical protein